MDLTLLARAILEAVRKEMEEEKCSNDRTE